MIQYRTTVRTLQGVVLMMENFESRDAMEQFNAQLLATDGASLLDGLSGVDTVVVEKDELCYGTWVNTNTRLVRIR